MTPRNSHFPRPSFDPHAEAISADVLLQDPTIGTLDRLEGRPWVTAADIAYSNLPAPVLAVTAARDYPAPDLEYQGRSSRWKSLVIGLVIGAVILVALVVLVVTR